MATDGVQGPLDAPDQRSAVVRLLASIILEAWVKADRVADLLAQAPGLKKKRPDPRAPIFLEESSVPLADALCDFGAVLRLADWERAGFRSHLPSDLPTAAEALTELRKSRNGTGDHRPGQLSARQLDVWLTHFAWSAPETIGKDVLVDLPSLNHHELLAELARFLWSHRHLMKDHGDVQLPNEE